MGTTTSELLPKTKSCRGPAPPFITLTTVPLQEHQGALHLSAAALEVQGPLPVEELPFLPVPSPPLGAHRLVMTPDRRPDCPTSATPSSTRSPAGVRASSPQLILPPQPVTSQETVASWTPPPSWPTTTTDTLRIIRPTAWASHRPAWPPWRPAPPTRCMGWDPGWAALGSASAREARLHLDQRLGSANTAALLASPTRHSTLTTHTADTHKECRLTFENQTPHHTNNTHTHTHLHIPTRHKHISHRHAQRQKTLPVRQGGEKKHREQKNKK